MHFVIVHVDIIPSICYLIYVLIVVFGFDEHLDKVIDIIMVYFQNMVLQKDMGGFIWWEASARKERLARPNDLAFRRCDAV